MAIDNLTQAMGGIEGSVSKFNSYFNVFSITLFVTVLTWGLIEATRKTVFAPLILSYLPSLNDKTQHLGNGQVLHLGKFIADLIVWMVLVGIAVFCWLILTTINDPSNAKVRWAAGGSVIVIFTAVTVGLVFGFKSTPRKEQRRP